jgi:hypothetical protein
MTIIGEIYPILKKEHREHLSERRQEDIIAFNEAHTVALLDVEKEMRQSHLRIQRGRPIHPFREFVHRLSTVQKRKLHPKLLKVNTTAVKRTVPKRTQTAAHKAAATAAAATAAAVMGELPPAVGTEDELRMASMMTDDSRRSSRLRADSMVSKATEDASEEEGDGDDQDESDDDMFTTFSRESDGDDDEIGDEATF